MADILNLIPAKADFSKMYVPVSFHETKKMNKLEIANDKSQNFQTYFNEINPIFIRNDNFYIGPSNTYSYELKYNKLVGLDNIDLFLETDNNSTEFVHGISDNLFFKTGGYIGVMEPEEFNKVEITPGVRVYEADSIFEAGNFLIKKYPIRSGSTVNFHCFETEKEKAACLFFIPKKRDIYSILVNLVSVNKDEDLDMEIANAIIRNDPKKDKYSKVMVSRFENTYKLCVGFFELSTHINIFEFDGVTKLQGVSFKD